MKIETFLKQAGRKIVYCRPTDTARAATQKLAEHAIGAMPVLGANEKLVGMISERDLVRAYAKVGPDLENFRVSDLLTKTVIFMGPNARLDDAVKTMQSHGFRHVPVISGGKLIGVVSMRDCLG